MLIVEFYGRIITSHPIFVKYFLQLISKKSIIPCLLRKGLCPLAMTTLFVITRSGSDVVIHFSIIVITKPFKAVAIQLRK